MKNSLTALGLLALILTSPTLTTATCRDTWIHGSETTSGGCGSGLYGPAALTKTVPVTIYWLDGYQRTVDVIGTGQAGDTYYFSSGCQKCWPGFHSPTWEDNGATAYWSQKTYPATINMSTDACSVSSTPSSDNRQGHTCSTVAAGPPGSENPETPPPDSGGGGGGVWSPVIVDTAGNGFGFDRLL